MSRPGRMRDLSVGTALFGVFFFLALFVQDVWGYSAFRTGVAFLPLTVAMLAACSASGGYDYHDPSPAIPSRGSCPP